MCPPAVQTTFARHEPLEWNMCGNPIEAKSVEYAAECTEMCKQAPAPENAAGITVAVCSVRVTTMSLRCGIGLIYNSIADGYNSISRVLQRTC